MADWVTGKVTKVQNWTDALFSLTVHAPVLPFTAGQFTKLGLEIDGERVQRAYSYVNSPDNPDLEFYLVTVPDGGLFLVGVFDIGRFGNRFAVSNLRIAHIAFDLKLAFQTVDNNLQMEFAHAFDDCLTGIRVSLQYLSLTLSMQNNYHRLIFQPLSSVLVCLFAIYS